jgi:hypothetical protein
MKPSTKVQLNVINSGDGTMMQIPQLENHEAYKYVGIYIALDGNQKAQVKDLAEKCVKKATVFSQLYFNAKDSEQGFATIYTPLIKYPLPTTSISSKKLQIIQQTIIKSALS